MFGTEDASWCDLRHTAERADGRYLGRTAGIQGRMAGT